MATIINVTTELLTLSFHKEDSFQIKHKVEIQPLYLDSELVPEQWGSTADR